MEKNRQELSRLKSLTIFEWRKIPFFRAYKQKEFSFEGVRLNMKKYFEKFGHTCDLKVEEEPETPRSLVKRIQKVFIEYSTINPLSNLTLQYFNDHANIMTERRLHLEKHPSSIHPFSRIKFYWEFIMALVFLIGFIAGPLQYLVYIDQHKEELFPGNFLLMKGVKIICLIDMIVRFFAGYWDEENFMVSTWKGRTQLYSQNDFPEDFPLWIFFTIFQIDPF